MHGVHHHLREVDELVVRCGCLREGVDPGLFHGGDAAQGAEDHPVGERRAPVGEVAVRQVAVVAGRHEEIFAAGALVGTRDAHVRDVAEPEVVDDAQRLRRCLDHRRTPRLEVKECCAVGGFGVRGEEEALRVGSWLGDADDPGRGDARRPRPRRIATNDAPGTALRNTSMPRIRSSASYALDTCPAWGRHRRSPAARTASPRCRATTAVRWPHAADPATTLLRRPCRSTCPLPFRPAAAVTLATAHPIRSDGTTRRVRRAKGREWICPTTTATRTMGGQA